jgi:hypothetical protein
MKAIASSVMIISGLTRIGQVILKLLFEEIKSIVLASQLDAIDQH